MSVVANFVAMDARYIDRLIDLYAPFDDNNDGYDDDGDDNDNGIDSNMKNDPNNDSDTSDSNDDNSNDDHDTADGDNNVNMKGSTKETKSSSLSPWSISDSGIDKKSVNDTKQGSGGGRHHRARRRCRDWLGLPADIRYRVQEDITIKKHDEIEANAHGLALWRTNDILSKLVDLTYIHQLCIAISCNLLCCYIYVIGECTAWI
jgi:hypothetical protein